MGWRTAVTIAVMLAAIIVLGLFVPLPWKAEAQLPQITLEWTAPADNVGVTAYYLRYSTVRPDTTTQAGRNSWWAAATSATGLPTPSAPGSRETFVVPGPFGADRTFYFVVRSADARLNVSEFSNVSVVVIGDLIPPARIIDLITR